MTHLPPGTVSHGTMCEEDLIPRFMAALESVNPDKADEIKQGLLETLFDALNDDCPDGHYFGAHPGDGSDYGVWPCEED